MSRFTVRIPQAALDSIFDDCDRYEADETGGRLLGTYSVDGHRCDVTVTALLQAGPGAERSPTFLMQDGDHQEAIFREIEAVHPDVEHLGNWHTHHVNGLQTLSGGDRQTYGRIVNHGMHNTDFLYALLVTTKNQRRSPRYDMRHFFFRRGDDRVYEVADDDVHVTDAPLLTAPSSRGDVVAGPAAEPRIERAKDQAFFEDFHPEMRALLSKTTGLPYWKGPLALIDGSLASVVAMESVNGDAASYALAVTCASHAAAHVLSKIQERRFPSARAAVFRLERELNEALFALATRGA